MGEYGFGQPEEDERPDFEFDPTVHSPERRKIKRELFVVAPKGFKIDESQLEQVLRELASATTESVEALRKNGYDYTSAKPFYPTPMFIQAQEINGTESRQGWSGLVEGIETKTQSVRRQQTVKELFHYASQILQVDQEEKNKVLDGIDLVQYHSQGKRGFLVDSDGRHRILTLKALTELGCDVTISGVKVNELGRVGK